MPHHSHHRKPILNDTERMAALTGGGVLALWAMRRAGLVASLAALSAGAMFVAAKRGVWPSLGLDGRRNEEMEADADGAEEPSVRSVNVRLPREEAYRIFRDMGETGMYFPGVSSVERLGDDRWRWTVAGSDDAPAMQEVELIEDEPGRRVAWRVRNEDGAVVEGSATFTDDGQGGAHIEVSITGDETVEELLSPARQSGFPMGAGPDLERLKQALESRRGNGPEASADPFA